ncbi:MAG: DUF1464 family protein [Candidatus Coatesbacteria bacterium]|nr:DUF1464 family protein [Candidatus Coatesbacteria bacterium]
MRVIGIDPGTCSFDLFGLGNYREILIDEAIKTEDVLGRPEMLLERVRALLPLDAIVGPSGYGIPRKKIEDMTDEDIGKMIPLDTKLAVNEGIKRLLLKMKAEALPVFFTPGVVHLPTVPEFRKWNRLDMGTADKVCCVALAIKDQSERLSIPFDETSFVLVEVGYAFTAAMAVEGGKITDGIGGTCGSPGFIAGGGMDAEIAIRLKPPVTQEAVFKGGLRDFIASKESEPEDILSGSEALRLLGESLEKDVAALMVSLRKPREIIISGRLICQDAIQRELFNRFKMYAPVAKVGRISEVAKEAACGAYLIGEGILGGRYGALVENMGI